MANPEFLETTDNAESTLASTLAAAATSLTVAAGEGALFPSSVPFDVTINAEIIKVGARSTDVLSSLTRAQEGTSDVEHASGQAVELRIISRHVNDLNAVAYPTATAVQVLAAATEVLANARAIRVAVTANRTLEATPTIAAGKVSGQLLTIINDGSSGNFRARFQDRGVLAGSLLALGATTRDVRPGGMLTLVWDGAFESGLWLERSYIERPVVVTPAINSFTINGSNALTLEIANVGTRQLTLVWTYTGVPSEGTVDVDDAGADPGSTWPATILTPFLTLGPSSATEINDEETTVATVYTFTPNITVNGQGLTTPTARITWLNRRYCGQENDGAALTDAEIIALAQSGLSNSKIATFFNIVSGAGEYVYFVYRSALGTGTYFSIENVAAKFNSEGIAAHVNASLFSENYQQYRSEKTNMGTVDFRSLSALANNRVYMGPDTDDGPTIPDANILALDDTSPGGHSKLQSPVAGTYTNIEIDGTEHLWFCHPDRYADLATIKDAVTELGIDGSYQTNVTHTNQWGYQETYRCWMSTNEGIFPTPQSVTVT